MIGNNTRAIFNHYIDIHFQIWIFDFQNRNNDLPLIHEIYFVKLKFRFLNFHLHLFKVNFLIMIAEFQSVICSG